MSPLTTFGGSCIIGLLPSSVPSELGVLSPPSGLPGNESSQSLSPSPISLPALPPAPVYAPLVPISLPPVG